MGTTGRVLCVVVALLCAPFPGQAEVYTYVDAQGARYYTNVPASGKYQVHQSQDVVISKPSSQPWPEVRVSVRRDWPKGSSGSSAYDLQISQCSYRYNVDPHLIKAIIRAESGFDCYAQSGKGAQGLMQLMPGTARDLNVGNPFDPRANIDGGTRYFRTMLDTFNGNIPLSLAAYNAGPNLVKQTNRMPEIPETVEYVQRVLQHYNAYKGVNTAGR
ncbi:MAG: lytic transglycosylase domain-containing protein [Desulfobulbaceae bacterium]|jgi:soluble lytic murein transglycosylase-like protein|nr:lytic transglycosylase domain-containing protein [Desulfobulbaceae bacterium]